MASSELFLKQWQDELSRKDVEMTLREKRVRAMEYSTGLAGGEEGVEIAVNRRSPAESVGCLINAKNELVGVGEGSPAERAGLTMYVGRVLTHINGRYLVHSSDLERLLREGGIQVALRFAPYGDTGQGKRCAECGKPARGTCPCDVVSYCSQNCQNKHWPSHIQYCRSAVPKSQLNTYTGSPVSHQPPVRTPTPHRVDLAREIESLQQRLSNVTRSPQASPRASPGAIAPPPVQYFE